MATIYFPAVIEAGKEGFGVTFPDLPGCVSYGATQQEAARMAEEALNAHLALMIEHKEQVPAPSEIDAAERDPDVKEVARVLVRADLPGQLARVNVTMDEALLKRIDAAAEQQGFSRSGYLAEAARQYMRANTNADFGQNSKGQIAGLEHVTRERDTSGFAEPNPPKSSDRKGARSRKLKRPGQRA